MVMLKEQRPAEDGPSPEELLDIGASRLNHYAVQVAPDGASEVVIHSQEEIEAGYSEDPYFVVIPSGRAVQFYARMDAPTTSGSDYPRSELREVEADGASMGFDPFSGLHRLSGRTRITHLPPNKPEVVIAQLHNGERDRVAIRTQLVGDIIRLRVRINGSSVTPELEKPYAVGTEFGWMIEIHDGGVRIYYARDNYPLPSTPIITGDLEENGSPSWYFKAGAYAQSNADTDDPMEYVAVELRDLRTEHIAQ
jgi:Alginate lyase